MQGIKYTLEKLKELFFNKFPDSKIEILELLLNRKVKCKDKYGEYALRNLDLLKGTTSSTINAIDKKQYFINKSKEIHGNKYNYSYIKYNKQSDKVKIICKKHGEFFQKVSAHFEGNGCLLCGGLAKRKNTNYFIKKAKEKHGNFYNYNLVNYITSNKKVIITCPIHGNFEQKSSHHLNGIGCPKCKFDLLTKLNSETPPGWSYLNWENVGNKSKNFDSFKVYIIKCWNENEEFYKIGKTFLKIEKRFNCKTTMPYNYKIIKIYEGTAREISKLEKELQMKNKKNKYIPKIKFNGMYECFNKISETELDLLRETIKKL